MNRQRYRLVFSQSLGGLVPVSESARGRGKSASGARRAGALLGSLLLALPALAEVPVPRAASFVTAGQAGYRVNGNQAFVNQVGNKAILNWQQFNVGAGKTVQFGQVNDLVNNQLVQGASFTTLNRIWDINPSVIAGSITQAAGQKANVILVNTNGIAFMGGSQVNLNSFTASSLDIADRFINESLFPGDRTPQFVGTGGFIKVFEGAEITAGNFGRVMLLAPTVINRGKVQAPDGQVIAAAASKVYLSAAGGDDSNVRGLLVEIDSPASLSNVDTTNTGIRNGELNGQAVALTSASDDKLGHVSNFGQLSAARGNVTMVGFAVNQMGMASATTSVVANGSVYLQAKDRAISSTSGTLDPAGAQRGGRVVLGAGSVTQVLPEMADATSSVDGTQADGLEKRSQIQVVGQDIRMAGGALIKAPSGQVSITAVDVPGLSGSIFTGNSPVSSTARVHIASGARIDVAGVEEVQVSAARNTVQVELRGDELKDSPINRAGPLRGQTAYVDIARALARAESGESTLMARDSLEGYQARTERTVAERSTSGGSVSIASQGATIIESSVQVDLSGGRVQYDPALVKSTLLSSAGGYVDLAQADAETLYTGIATRYTIDYGRWNVKETIDLGENMRFDPGYVEGKDAGSMSVFGMGGTYMRADVQGRTTVGELQRNAGTQPQGARLTVGFDDVVSDRNAVDLAVRTRDYKINQAVSISNAALSLPGGFGFGDALPAELAATLTLDAQLLGKDKVAQLEVFSNQAVTVRDALRTAPGGRVSIVGSGVDVAADITAVGGAIGLTARNTVSTVPPALAGPLADPRVNIADGVQLSTRGAWVNDLPGQAPGAGAVLIDGGRITLSAESQTSGTDVVSRGVVSLGQGAVLDATGGARLNAQGELALGDGGEISVTGFEVSGVSRNLHAHGAGQGGKLTLGSNDIRIGGTPDATTGVLNLDAGFFQAGGFADINLNALNRLSVEAGTVIQPTLQNLELQSSHRVAASGTPIEQIASVVRRDDLERQTTQLKLSAQQSARGTGEVVVGEGARIETDPQGSVSFAARNKIEILGTVKAAGGSITATLDRTQGQVNGATNANAIFLGSAAVLDVAGQALTRVDGRGLTRGQVLNGGVVDLNARSGYVITQAGSRIDVSGAAPVVLGVMNDASGLGRPVASDAGTVKLFVEQGALLDGEVRAAGGSASQRGGDFELMLSKYVAPGLGQPPQPDITLSLAASVAHQATGLTADSAVPNGDIERVKLGTDALEAAGFDRIRLASRDTIEIKDGVALGAGRAQALREVTLDAALIRTEGGHASIQAETLRAGNYDPARVSGRAATGNTGTLTLQGAQLELAGTLRLEGMERAQLVGTERIALAGVTAGTTRPVGELDTTANLNFDSALVAPTTYTDYKVVAPGRDVSFARNTDAPTQPLSALGTLTVQAENIVQGGHLWAPLGRIDLQAADTVTLLPGSTTTVAALPGSVLPFGKILNGRTWVYDVDADKVPAGQLEQTALGEKSIRTSGRVVDLQAGAKVDVAGGGDLQAYEWTVGPGGSRDILAQPDTYAILPGYRGGVAPGDVQEAKGFDRQAGDAVYLSGVPGLADGVYTLLPAHYALLPGAMAVQVNTGVQDLLPGQAYTRQDGVRIAAGYLTDTRAGAPRDARWQGVQVLTGDQVKERSEFSLVRASSFFVDANNRPQDAGQLSVATTGAGPESLRLDAAFKLAAAQGGRAAAVDISAANLAITSGTPTGIAPTTTVLDVDKLNALGAGSLLIGGTRTVNADTTTLTVGADTVTLANDASHALSAPEVILAARDTVTLRSGSVIDAQGEGGDAGSYTTAGNGALVRAASTSARFQRTGDPDRSAGTLIGETGSVVRAAGAITIDATRNNAFKGTTEFRKSGVDVAADLSVGATRINFGAAPAAAEGITYSQADLDALSDTKNLVLTSYSTFDLYGDVQVGREGADGKSTLERLTLQGAGLAGIDNSGRTATVRADNLTLNNPASVAFAAGGALGTGTLELVTDTLTLGVGTKAVQGFSQVHVTGNEVVVATGQGATTFSAPTTLNVARLSGESRSNQAIASTGALVVNRTVSDRVLAEVTALGAQMSLAGSSVNFNAQAVLPSGALSLQATGGDLTVGANASIDVAGRTVRFFDTSAAAQAGQITLGGTTGDVNVVGGARLDVSAAAGGDAGTLVVRAVNGTVGLADGTVRGAAVADASGQRGDGARVDIDTGTLASFSNLNQALNQGGIPDGNGGYSAGFDGERTLRVRQGDVTIAAGDTTKAQDIRMSVDGGALTVAGQLDASGADAGRVELFGKNDVTLAASARIAAVSSGARQDGGDVVIGTRDGTIRLNGGSIQLGGGAGGEGGTLLLRAPRVAGNTDVAVTAQAGALDSAMNSARSVAVEAVRVYAGINTLTTSGASSGSTLSLETVRNDNGNAAGTTGFAQHHAAIKSKLGQTGQARFHVLSGVEVRTDGSVSPDLTLAGDWNLDPARSAGEPGVLTLRAQGALNLNNNLSDGFSTATACTTAVCNATTPVPSILRAGNSWSYRLVAGADSTAADPLSVLKDAGDVTLAGGKLVRTGTGDIQVAAGGNIVLANNQSVIYTAGRVADAVTGFATPPAILNPVFGQGGGDVDLTAMGSIIGKPSAQLYSQWLFRQGALNSATGAYTRQPAWWVRYDQFQQGVGALGGGDVSLRAGVDIQDLSVSTPTQGRVTGAGPQTAQLVETGGGDLRVEAGRDVLGGQYYAARDELVIKARGSVGPSSVAVNGNAQPVATLLALGDAQARVQANGNVTLSNLLNPHLLAQTQRNLAVTLGVQPSRSLFSTYGAHSAASVSSLSGQVVLRENPLDLTAAFGTSLLTTAEGNRAGLFDLAFLLPSSVSATAFQGSVALGTSTRNLTMSPSASGQLSVLAADSVQVNSTLTMGDQDAALVPSPLRPANTVSQTTTELLIPRLVVNPEAPLALDHASVPVHTGDTEPARVYAVKGDVSGFYDSQAEFLYGGISVPKATLVRAGRDVKDFNVVVQHSDAADISHVEAGRDVTFSGVGRRDTSKIWIGGQGRMEVNAGRNIDLGTSGGVVSRGDLDNNNLPASGADLQLTAGTGAAGTDYTGAVERLLGRLQADPGASSSLWLARWLVGDDALTAGAALGAVQAVAALSPEVQRERVRSMVFTALRTTGRDSNLAPSGFAGDYSRGYAALEVLFPGISDTTAGGAGAGYQGNIDLFASRIKTERNGNIEFLIPGGDLIVGLANTPADLVNTGSNVLGIVAAAEGTVRGFARDDMLVNQSRILTVGGGDVLLWSSEGDIDAGKGKKTASAVPPPLITVDDKGNVTQVLQGAVSGSGIGALSTNGVTAGDVDLIAPKGTVNAGDAGIRAGNLNIAALVVLGADNISVSGTSAGTPIADTSAVSAASSGATSGGDDTGKVVEALNQAAAESAKAAQELASALRPSVVRVDVLGFGE
ncbi:filamentous haemagglutinin family protein [Hydrogenophaga sp. PBL-H3]|uniref:filamentous haemagglutinin family protein n=1 Tax=Hydrogenophaga sp. PBL-H3 TaxID=434010 RepID=UPI00131FB4B9|nr:filamentous haemagglutinin family protein [Hydrogenophaga sp. PBL-H3]QHE75953.1 filamentous hemagglutinin N-terminal domain-containing protein [Hydrogenophaga sp. PBL-H3]QHE80377.1 filamentous hemagglutinin N-terminal domain-containing protein [Hydrogenophaga sp. PBL-H3]